MGAFDGWGSAALGGGIGGTATGIALFFTIRHDRRARGEDRLHASADRALLGAANLLATLLTNQARPKVLSDVVLFSNASITFLARMAKNDPAETFVSDIHNELNNRALEFRRTPNATAAKLGAAARAYLDAVGIWLLTPGTYKPEQDVAAFVAGYDENPTV